MGSNHKFCNLGILRGGDTMICPAVKQNKQQRAIKTSYVESVAMNL